MLAEGSTPASAAGWTGPWSGSEPLPAAVLRDATAPGRSRPWSSALARCAWRPLRFRSPPALVRSRLLHGTRCGKRPTLTPQGSPMHRSRRARRNGHNVVRTARASVSRQAHRSRILRGCRQTTGGSRSGRSFHEATLTLSRAAAHAGSVLPGGRRDKSRGCWVESVVHCWCEHAKPPEGMGQACAGSPARRTRRGSRGPPRAGTCGPRGPHPAARWGRRGDAARLCLWYCP